MKNFFLLPCFLFISLAQAQEIILPEGAGLKSELWAGEDQVANPVCLAVDEKNRVFIGETFRQNKGVEDNRSRAFWLLDDLAAQSVEDRHKLLEKWSEKVPMEFFTKYEDRITRLADTNGDGKADARTIFADGFNDALDGTGAGLIARNNSIWYTCIPSLWRFQDADEDGVADSKESLSTGYGVRWALRGHDLHGLAWGPDGRLYYSIGDRGYNVTTKEGGHLHDPGAGAVFRCEPDGSDLEVFCTGLRNPQELAFDQFGNLFTGDNNSDAGDRARIVYCAEGGMTGWQMSYQTLEGGYARGPWHMDRIWQTQHEGQVAWSLPPIAHVGNGPSGFLYYPGIGLPDRYRNHFFMVDFKASPANSLIHAFECRVKGAGFELVDLHPFAKNFVPTDAEFGYDGKMYVADWISGWNGTGKGKVHAIYNPEIAASEDIENLTRLMAGGLEKQEAQVLGELLRHPDQRVRLRAQFELARQGRHDILAATAKQYNHRLSRLHGIWGIGQICRARGNGKAAAALMPLLKDADTEVIAQTARLMGEAPYHAAIPALRELTIHNNARVKYFTAMALGRLQHANSIDLILEILRANQDKDVFLRHACVMGLSWIGDARQLVAKSGDEDPSVRLGILLALRRLESNEVAKFLMDTEDSIIREAAIAIYDTPIQDAMGHLANLLSRYNSDNLFDPFPAPQTDSVLRRAIDAAFIAGEPKHAKLLAEFAEKSTASDAMQALAVDALGHWENPPRRDPVHGFYRELPPRETEGLKELLAAKIPNMIKAGNKVQRAAIRVAGIYEINLGAEQVLTVALDPTKEVENRVEAMRKLNQSGGEERKAIRELLQDRKPGVRAEAIRLVGGFDPQHIIKNEGSIRGSGSPKERQALIETLAAMNLPEADNVLKTQLQKMIEGRQLPEIQLELLEAATARDMRDQIKAWESTLSDEDKLAPWRICLEGGDAKAGRAVFENATAQCMRCHNTKKGHSEATMAGPDLMDVGKHNNREQMLRHVIFPNDEIKEGFGTISITKKDESVVAGILKNETDDMWVLQTPDNKTVEVAKRDVKSKTDPVSSMPPIALVLSKRQIRDLMEYLSSLK